jgi:hypothetical protein
METTNSRFRIHAAACLLPLCLTLWIGGNAPAQAQARPNHDRPLAARLRPGRCQDVTTAHGDRSNEARGQDDDTASAAAKDAEPGQDETHKSGETKIDPLTALQRSGLLPKTAKPNAVLSETELAALIRAAAKPLGAQTDMAVAVKQTAAPVERLRVLTVLVRLSMRPEEIASYREAVPEQMPPDADALPLWGRPYAAAAVDRGWWKGDRALRPRENATWAFAALLLQKMLPAPAESREAKPHATLTKVVASSETPDETYSGLVLDARGMRSERQIGPRVLDEDGHVVYPDPKFLPEIDWLEDHGMADYDATPDSAHRAGNHPLTVKALNTSGPGHDDFVVSNADAELIRRAVHRFNFMKTWAVSILVAPK